MRQRRSQVDQALASLNVKYSALGVALRPILDRVQPDVEDEADVDQIDLVEKCRRLERWVADFIQDAASFAGAHVLALARSHYPFVDVEPLKDGWPAGVDGEKVADLRRRNFDLAAAILEKVDV